MLLFFASLDGHLDPVSVTQKFLQQAEKHLANVVYPCEVTALHLNDGKLSGVATTLGEYPLDRIVIAGGVDTPELAEQAGYTPPLMHAPGILLHTKPAGELIGRVVESPHLPK